jgi:hypothetical protein
MKTLFCFLFSLVAGIAPAYAITVKTPANGATVTSPFSVAANTSTCDSKAAVSMGYSIDHGKATIVSTNFNATVSASVGTHTLHIKCWGKKVNDEQLLKITVVAKTTPPDPPNSTVATPTFSPVTGTYPVAQTVSLTSSTPGATIYYTTDGSAPTTASLEYSGEISVDTSAVIEAIAVAPGYTNSGLARADYLIKVASSGNPLVPSSAISVSQIQLQSPWHWKHDPGTIGSSTGVMTTVEEPSLSGTAAKFESEFKNWGGEIYTKTWDHDANAKNFLYDAQVWIEKGSVVGNLEMDNNQVIANGDTVIYAFQCAGDHNTWDYSSNAGTPKHPDVKWIRSNQPCNPEKWTPNAWHHVQISYSRDDEGNVTYHSVWLDGVEAPINETVNSAFSLGWGKAVLMTNFQVDGVGSSGASTLYLDNLTIYRW